MDLVMLPKHASAALLLACLAAGCAVGPDYVKPDAPIPDRFRGQTAVEQRPANTAADLSTWWAGFGDPQLTRLVQLALEQNLDLAQAFARVTQARAGLGAANAALLPSGNVTGQARVHTSLSKPHWAAC